MNRKHQEILRKMRKKIVEDLEIGNIIDALISEDVVTIPLHDEIKQEQTNKAKIQKLLDQLPKRGPRAYSEFKEAMRSNYAWLSEKMDDLENAEDCVDSLNNSLEPTAPRSHLPANPPLSVKRTQKMEKLREGLTELLPGYYLVLHALPGYGKSSLASATLQDKTLVAESFQNEFYWIKFGQNQSVSENILVQLNILFHQVWNLDHLAEPTSEEALKYSLKRHFFEHNYALIILDDANSQDVINAFDFGCKTLVLTTDVDILREKRYKVIEMCDGFSANESLDLFSEATGIPVLDLPKQARQIHEECKGMPLMISMFSARFQEIKESLAKGHRSDQIWSYYLNALRERKPNVLQESLERQAATFDICINKLSCEDKKCYETLAIFPEDVNIPTMTLSIFWSIELAEVDLKMSEFYKKSLACKKWHEGFKTYVYGVHNLLLCHLRSKLKPEYLRELHRSYVKKNLEICNGDFSKLPTDNYIHSYIGYHMEKGALISDFSILYLDFAFIEVKVFYTGPGDLLIDLKKYKSHITQGSLELSERVEDLEQFLIQQASTLAEYRRRNCLDLVQVALKHPLEGFVRKTAERLANERLSSLYFNHLKHDTEYLDSLSEELHLQVRSVAFTNETDVILIGNNEGKIISWNCTNKHHEAYYGNVSGEPITKIVFPENQEFFLSISGAGTAKLFDLRRDSIKQKSDHIKTLHPRTKQCDWINMSDSRSSQDDSRITFSIPNERIMDLAVSVQRGKIAVCTDAGSVAIWNFNGDILVQSGAAPRMCLMNIAFVMEGTLLVAVNMSTQAFVVQDGSNAQYKTQFPLNPGSDKIISLLSVPQYNNFLVVLLETKLYKVTWPIDGDFHRKPSTKEFAKLPKEATSYTSAAATQDGKYIVTADTGGSINVCELHNEFRVVRTYKNLVSTLDTHWLQHKSCHIICGGNRDTLVPMVHRWEFDPNEKPVVQRLPLFDATMKAEEKNMIVVTTSNGTVQIIQNDDVIAETHPVTARITSLLLFENTNHVVYGTDSGSVYLFDIKLNHSKEIMELTKPVDFVKVLQINKKDFIVCNQGTEDLQVWRSPNDTQLVESTGAVIFCDIIINVQRVLTIAKSVLKIWDPKTWRLHSKYEAKTVPGISCCSLSLKQNYVAVANAQGNINVLKLSFRQDLRNIKFEEYYEQKFPQGITACSFSQDEQLLAVGFRSGEINVLDIRINSIIQKIELHRQPVKQLYWSPLEFDEPVLLSLANELAWWNIFNKAKKETQREISHSLSELTITSKHNGASSVGNMRMSKSCDLGNVKTMDEIFLAEDNDEILKEESSLGSFSSLNSRTDLSCSSKRLNATDKSEASYFWGLKKPKYSKIDGLLNVVKLDGDLATKVCISNDFSNFVTLNGDGSIYNLSILEPINGDSINWDT